MPAKRLATLAIDGGGSAAGAADAFAALEGAPELDVAGVAEGATLGRGEAIPGAGEGEADAAVTGEDERTGAGEGAAPGAVAAVARLANTNAKTPVGGRRT